MYSADVRWHETCDRVMTLVAQQSELDDVMKNAFRSKESIEFATSPAISIRSSQPAVRRCSATLLAAICLAITITSASAQDTPDYFRANCMNCHTVGGGRLTGPDLKNVGQRRVAEWLISFMQNPKAVVDSGDVYFLPRDARHFCTGWRATWPGSHSCL